MLTFLSVADSCSRLSSLDIGQGCTVDHHHADGILEFSKDQRAEIRTLVSLFPFVAGNLDFVLLASGTYWDFPFTLGLTTIVVTEKFFTFQQKLLVLAHEWVHLQQRIYPYIFTRIYRKWGFSLKTEETQLPSEYKLLRNPDGEKYEWLWTSPSSGQQYLPFCHIRTDCTFEVLFAEVNTSNRTTGRMILPTKEFLLKFPAAKHQNYHPNEISAHIFAEQLLKLPTPVDQK
jgi:hypothetical protein